MQLRKVGMHEVVKDKAMENGLQDMDDQYALNKKCEERIHNTKWCFGECQDV